LVVGKKVVVRVRPEDVLLCAEHPGRVSARNVLAGHVRSIQLVPEGAYIQMDLGFPLVSLVTRRAVSDLALRKGGGVYALIKATAVQQDLSTSAPFRVSPRGKRGMIEYEKLDLMKSIERTGSLSAGARDLGVTYRTAWIWVESVNRAWGSSLISRTRGGKGGGGAALTPEGVALLRWASKIESLPAPGHVSTMRR
jgi:molybdate transport repressor ModE-like protein/molybdopterin-binding protein